MSATRSPLPSWKNRLSLRIATSLWLLLGGAILAADELPSATAILQRVLAQRAPQDFQLQARLLITRDQTRAVELLVRNTATGSATIYRAGADKLLVVQPVAGPVRFFLRGRGELLGAARLEKFAGSSFACYDLGLPFLWWPQAKLLGEERHRGRQCHLLEATTTGEPYSRVRLWLDQEYAALLRVEAFDERDQLVKRVAVTSFKRIGEVWVPRALEAAVVLPGPTLPSQEKSRLEVISGTYDTELPSDWFAPERFGPDR